MPQGLVMGSPIVLGKDAKVRLNNVALGVRTGSIVETAADHEVGDTEDAGPAPNATFNLPPGGNPGIGYEVHEGGRRVADITMEWYSNYTLIPINAFGIYAGSVLVGVNIFPKGVGFAAWVFPFMTVLRNEPCQIDINQPQSARFSGKSSGSYTAPAT